MNNYIKNSGFENIDFLYNNSFLIEDKIITGTRGWISNLNNENLKILKRENERLKLSIKSGIEKYGEDKEIIVLMHYPPFIKENVENIDFVKTMKEFNVSKCFYGHLHSDSHKEAIEGKIENIEFKLVSSDYTNFDLLKID